jgi:NADPH:quinone reductase-like Zn-dependent oxidoreductase
MRVNNAKQSPVLIAASLPQPRAGEGQLLIRVRATGATPTELLWYPTTHTKGGGARTGAVPGHEFSGVIAAVGKDINDFYRRTNPETVA